MKRLYEVIPLAMMLALCVVSCSKDDTPQKQQTENNEEVTPVVPKEDDTRPHHSAPRAIPLTEEQLGYVGANNDFAFSLYRRVMEQAGTADTSSVFSPLSVTYALGMVAEGAEGETLEEIKTALGFGADAQGITGFCQTMMENAPLADETVKLNIANSFYLNSLKHFTLKDSYASRLKSCYKADIESLDFSQPSSADHINSWCNLQTNGMIPKVLEKLDKDAVSYLLNALYFKAYWNVPFDKEETQDGDFTKTNGTKQTVPFMHREGEIMYARIPNLFSSVTLPYGNGSFRMHILLPDEGHTTGDVLTWLTQENWTSLVNYNQHGKEVDLLLPRFKVEFDAQDLISPLMAMGIRGAFGMGGSLTGICNEQDLLVGQMFQKAVIDVNETGSEGAAVTVVGVYATSVGDDRGPIPFHANRPFIYLITEGSTGAVFFIGTYTGY